MKKALQQFKSEICNIKDPQSINDSNWQKFIENTVVVLMAGGESSRFSSVPGSDKSNKNSHKLPNGDTMIEMTIRMYRDAGLKDFVALVYHKAETIAELLGDGSELGVNIKYSYDPEHPVGKGGAVLNALLNGSIPEDKNVIVHNPDDVILNSSKDFPRHIASGFTEGTEKGAEAAIVVVEETPLKGIEMYPMIPIPTHIGVTIFSPKAFPRFKEKFNLKEKADFEKILFPILAAENKLYAVSIPIENWLAVNTLKAYNQFIEKLA